MTRHVWRAADASVVLWEPALEATTTTVPQEPHPLRQSHTMTETKIQTSLCSNDEQDLVLPSVEDFFGTYIKSESEENIDLKTPETPRYASRSTQPFSSPCPRIAGRTTTQLLNAAKTSHYFEVCGTEQKPPVRRTLDFGMITLRDTVSAASQHTELNEFGSLVALRKLERVPPHRWCPDERTLLTILYRWYEDSDVTTLPSTFNAITNLDLRPSVVRYQFESHLILYGGRAYPEFDRVMKVPFHDPDQKYDDIHTIIQETAAECGIKLSRRAIEVKHKSGLAQHARSPTTRKYYKSLVRRAAKREKEKAHTLRDPPVEEPPLRVLPLGGVALAADPRHEDEESWSDIEELCISPPSPRAPPSTHTIAFRVWDANSRTSFDEETGFVSQAFSIWRGEFPPPFSPDGQGRQALMLLTNLHLSMTGGASAFVSVSTSLLQALVKASTMKDPRIAVVALDHALLQEPNKTLPAADVMRMLKAEGQAWWARYKGCAERIIWASVPAASVISHLSLSELCELSNNDQACAEILCLDEIRSGRKTQYVSSQLREKNNVISVSTARVMAFISRIFGMHRHSASLAHIQGLVSSLVDSFQLKEISLNKNNNYTSRNTARAFAVSLRSRAHSVQDVEAAFQDGVQQGTATIAFYTRRHPAVPRRRTS